MKVKRQGWSTKVKKDVRRVRNMPIEEFEEEGSDYRPAHTLIGRSLACSVCGALGEHHCVPVMVEAFLRSPTLQNAYFEILEAYRQNPEYLEELSDE